MSQIVLFIAAIAVAFILFKIIKGSIKLAINGVIGVVLLFIINFVATSFGFDFNIPINILTALIAGIFGIPGVILMSLWQIFF